MEHKEKLNLQNKEYYKQNKEELKKKAQQWYHSEKGRDSVYQSNLKRRSYKNHVRFEGIRRKELLDRDNWECRNCGCKVHDKSIGGNQNRHLWDDEFKAHIDHIIPISKGGNSDPSNLQVLCRTCNLSKHDKVEKQMEMTFDTIQ
jgi:5-methylcytosine-specific restriction endonuclease McrA